MVNAINIKAYWQYFKYIVGHKKNVFVECWGAKQYLHAFTHDFSKLRPSEFFPYAKYFYVNKEKHQKQFNKAWRRHYVRNKHHWNYWWDKQEPMPAKYIRQMICDWKAMSRKFGGTAQTFYLNNYKKIKLMGDSRLCLEANLGVAYQGLDDWCWYHTIEEIILDALRYKEKCPDNYNGWLENEYLPEFKEKYDVDMMTILGLEDCQKQILIKKGEK